MSLSLTTDKSTTTVPLPLLYTLTVVLCALAVTNTALEDRHVAITVASGAKFFYLLATGAGILYTLRQWHALERHIAPDHPAMMLAGKVCAFLPVAAFLPFIGTW